MKGPAPLLRRAALLGLPFLLLLGTFEVWKGWDRSVYTQKKKALDQAASQTEVLVLGSSQAYYGVDAASLSPHALNLAFPAQSLRYDEALLEQCLARCPNLKLVLLPLSYFTLQYELEYGAEARRACHYRYYFGIPNHSTEHRDQARNFFGFLLSGRQQCAGLLRQKLRDILGRTHGPSEQLDVLDAQGGLLQSDDPHPSPDELQQDARWVIRMHHAGMRPALLPGNIARLERIDTRLRARGIQLAFFTPPVSAAYAAVVDPARQQQWQATMTRLSETLHVPYRNYARDERFHADDFRDSNHLNQAGRRRFSQILATDLVAPVRQAAAR